MAILNALLNLLSKIMMPFITVYLILDILLKKIGKIIAYAFGGLMFIYIVSISFMLMTGDTEEAKNNFVGLAGDMRTYFDQLPSKIPVWIQTATAYLQTHIFVRNLLFVYLIGFACYHFAYMYSYREEHKRQVNTVNNNVQQDNNVQNNTYDPTGGFTKAHFDVFFPEGWEERRKAFREQIKNVNNKNH
jgi:hypothetical protein